MVFGSACRFRQFLRQSFLLRCDVDYLRFRDFCCFVLGYVWDVVDGLFSFDDIEVVVRFFFLLQCVFHVI